MDGSGPGLADRDHQLTTNLSRSLPLVSVIIPMFNAQQWIEETLRSVLAQTHDHDRLEIIVVDDGSTDAGRELAAQLLETSDVRHRIIQQENSGPSSARNAGWNAAGGEWIQFLDADDLLVPEKIATQVQSEGGSPAILHSPWQRLGPAEPGWTPVGEVAAHSYPPGAEIEHLITTDGFLHLSACLLRRDWLCRVGGFDERFWLIEDVDLLVRIAIAGGTFCHMPSEAPLSFYRQRPDGSLSRRDHAEFVDGCVRNAEMVEAHWRRTDGLTPERRRILVEIYFQAARHYARHDRRRFDLLAGRLEALIPGFRPAAPAKLRLVSTAVGYRRAEWIAGAYQRVKRTVQTK